MQIQHLSVILSRPLGRSPTHPFGWFVLESGATLAATMRFHPTKMASTRRRAGGLITGWMTDSR
jgi:hypothetical protein